MKRNLIKKLFISLISVSIVSVVLLTSCSSKAVDLTGNPSDKYYKDKTNQFLLYGYHTPTDGSYRIDSDVFYTVDDQGNRVDFRTTERYKEYLDCGMNLLFLQGNDPYMGYNFEESQLKKNMDNSLEAGLNRVSVFDNRIYWPSTLGVQNGTTRITYSYLKGRDTRFKDLTKEVDGETISIIPEGASDTDYITDPEMLEVDYSVLYKSSYNDKDYNALSGEEKDELTAKVTANFNCLVDYFTICLSEYCNHPAFYGVMLIDEPAWYVLPQVGVVHKALKAAGKNNGIEDMYIQVNLLPMDAVNSSGRYSADPNFTVEQAYEDYCRKYIIYSGAKRLGMDIYPIRETKSDGGSSYSIYSKYFANMMILCKVCKEFGCSLAAVAQSVELTKDIIGNSVSLKAPNKSEMYWQLNSYMGFGVDEVSYYVYWSKQDNALGGYHTDGTSFITHDGERTDMYYWVKEIQEGMQRFAPVVLNFKYQSLNYYTNGRAEFSFSYLTGVTPEKENFDVLKGVKVNEYQVALVTELKDPTNGQYMYMLMNPNCPSNGVYSDVSTTAELDFGTDYKAVEVWYKGEKHLYPLNNGKISFTLAAGYAVYVMPY